MEFIKTVDTLNFRVTVTPTVTGKAMPDSKDPVKASFSGTTDDGIRFFASKRAMAMLPTDKRSLPELIRLHESMLVVCKNMGYLQGADVDELVKKRTTQASVASPAPLNVDNPFNAVNPANTTKDALDVPKRPDLKRASSNPLNKI